MVNKKLFLFLILGLFLISFVSAAEWTSNMDDGTIFFFSYENSAGTTILDNVTDGQENTVMAGDGTLPLWTTGKLGQGLSNNGDEAYVIFPQKARYGGDRTMCTWARILANHTGFSIFAQQWVGSFYWDAGNAGDTVRWLTGAGSIGGTINVSDGEWHHHCITTTTGNTTIYFDGKIDVSSSTTLIAANHASDGEIGGDGASIGIDGWYDEFLFSNRSWSAVEINYYYNGGEGIPYHNEEGSGLEVILNSPANDTSFATSTIIFNTTVTDNLQVQNVSLLIDGILDQTNTSGFNGTYALTKALESGIHNWSILAYDNDSNFVQSETRTINITIVSPTIILYSPENNFVTPTKTQTFIGFVTDDFEITNVSLYLDGSLNETDFSGLKDVNYSFTKILGEGAHTWYYKAYDNDSNPTDSSTWNVYIDTTGPIISIVSPANVYGFLNEGDELELNFTAIDPNLDICISEYDGVNTTRSCSSGISFSTNFSYYFGINEITVYANDTSGNWNSETQTWTIQLSEISRTFNSNVVQTAQETFIYSGGTGTGVSVVSGKLWYNGTSYTPVVTKSGSLFNITNILEIPSNVEGYVEFFWEIVYQNSTGTFSFNTTNSNQTIFDLVLYECSAPITDGLTLNFTTFDSTNLTAINSTLEATFQFYAEGGTGDTIVEYLFSDLNENRSNYLYCLNSSGQNVTLDAFISYSATDHDRREYIISNGIIGNFTQSIPLYLTLTALTDIVTITVQDQNYEPITGALVAVQRWNIGTNTYSTIGMLTTSSSGQGIIDLELYTTWYRSVVYINGGIAEITDVQKLDSTSWIITVEAGEDNPYDLFGDISHGLTFDNSTNITSFTWFDSSGYTSRGCLVVKNKTSLGEVTIFNSCVSSVSGTIDFLLSGEGSFTAYGVILLEGYDVSQIVDVLDIRIGTPEIIEKVSPFGKVISMIMIGTGGLIGVAAGSAILGVFIIIFMLIMTMYFGFLNITTGFIWGIISIGIIILFLQRRKR